MTRWLANFALANSVMALTLPGLQIWSTKLITVDLTSLHIMIWIPRVHIRQHSNNLCSQLLTYQPKLQSSTAGNRRGGIVTLCNLTIGTCGYTLCDLSPSLSYCNNYTAALGSRSLSICCHHANCVTSQQGHCNLRKYGPPLLLLWYTRLPSAHQCCRDRLLMTISLKSL